MNKRFSLLLCLLLIVTLTGCGTQKPSVNESAEQQADFAPANTALPAENSSILDAASAFSGGSIDADPTAEPIQPILSEEAAQSPEASADDIFGTYSEDAEDAAHSASQIDLSTYSFTSITDTSLGFTFSYPSHWQNNPGVYTVCYREEVEEGDFPARVAITRKKLTHTADADGIADELKSYLKTIYKQYDAKTFEVGSLNKSIQFMGQKGYSTTYLAFSGETEVKGFVICCQIERTLYVFHFSASYSDYLSMEGIMQYMCKSVKPA